MYDFLQPVTIDPAGSMDLDDAIYVEPARPGGWIVTVLIANVALHVPPHSLTDATARSRLATHYRAWGSRPMLPRVIAEERASLLVGGLRPVMMVRMMVSEIGEIVGPPALDVFATTISSRFTYEDIPEIIRSSTPHTAMLSEAERCAAALAGRRRSTGALTFYDLLRGWAVTEDGQFAKVSSRRMIGHLIVQEFMVAANTVIADFANFYEIPILYRNHESGADRTSLLHTLSQVLKSPDIAIEEYRRSIGHQLKRAVYGSTAKGHFGLNAKRYTHATSPIRRYADLITQRQIVAHLAGRALPYTQGDLDKIADEINAGLLARETATTNTLRLRANQKAEKMIEMSTTDLNGTDLERVVKVLVRTGGDLPSQVRPLFDKPLPVVLMAYVLAGSDRDGAGWSEVRKALLDKLDGSTAVSVLTTASQHPELKVGIVQEHAARSGGIAPKFTTLLSLTYQERKLTAVGVGLSTKDARQKAAIGLAHLLAGFEPPQEILPDTSAPAEAPTIPGKDPISALMEIAQKVGVDMPTFEFTPEGPANRPTFKCMCRYGQRWAKGEGPSKQASKRDACITLLAELANE